MVSPAIFDSSAVLAVIFDEPGSESVIDLLQGGLLSTVNLTEIHTRLLLDGRPEGPAWDRVLGMGLEVLPFSRGQARTAAQLIGLTKRFGLSLGDRACLALAIERRGTVYTTDRIWTDLPLELRIEVIR